MDASAEDNVAVILRHNRSLGEIGYMSCIEILIDFYSTPMHNFQNVCEEIVQLDTNAHNHCLLAISNDNNMFLYVFVTEHSVL